MPKLFKKKSPKKVEKPVEKTVEVETNIEEETDEQKVGKYFIQLKNEQEARLLSEADDIDKHIAELSNRPFTNEDIMGNLRAISGQARLLATKKLKQFEDLCVLHMNQTGDGSEVRADDIRGFWDMINIQIQQIHKRYNDFDSLIKNKPV